MLWGPLWDAVGLPPGMQGSFWELWGPSWNVGSPLGCCGSLWDAAGSPWDSVGSLWVAACSPCNTAAPRAFLIARAFSTSHQPRGPSFLFPKSLCRAASHARGAACAVSAPGICFELLHLESRAGPGPRPQRGPPGTPAPLPALPGLGSHRLPASFFGWVQRKFIVSAAQFLELLFIQVDSSTLEKTILFFSLLAPLFEMKKEEKKKKKGSVSPCRQPRGLQAPTALERGGWSTDAAPLPGLDPPGWEDAPWGSPRHPHHASPIVSV